MLSMKNSFEVGRLRRAGVVGVGLWVLVPLMSSLMKCILILACAEIDFWVREFHGLHITDTGDCRKVNLDGNALILQGVNLLKKHSATQLFVFFALPDFFQMIKNFSIGKCSQKNIQISLFGVFKITDFKI